MKTVTIINIMENFVYVKVFLPIFSIFVSNIFIIVYNKPWGRNTSGITVYHKQIGLWYGVVQKIVEITSEFEQSYTIKRLQVGLIYSAVQLNNNAMAWNCRG